MMMSAHIAAELPLDDDVVVAAAVVEHLHR